MSGRLNHAVIPVRTGQMTQALSFMLAFGFKKEDYEAHGDWGFAYFVSNKWGERVQLTVPKDQRPFIVNKAAFERDDRALSLPAPMLSWVHVGIECDVNKMREQIVGWAKRNNLTPEFEDVPGGKLFVSLLQIFWIDIELVPLLT